MLHGPSMVRVGNTAYIDLDMSDLSGPVAAEVTGKFYSLTFFPREIISFTLNRD